MLSHVTRCLPNVLLTAILSVLSASAQDGSPTSYVNKLGIDMDVRSGSRVIADEFLSGNLILPEMAGPIAALPGTPSIQLRGGNVQASDPALDYVQIFSGFRPFVRATQSEVSIASRNNNIVVGYNNSAGAHVSPVPGGLIVDRLLFSGYSYSKDGGQSWASGYLPAVRTGASTFGDPSVGVDRHGVFYYASLGSTATGAGGIIVNRSNDGGATWSNAVVVQEDPESDKEWLAVGPDPTAKNRDNIYVAWTSFQNAACELRFGRSTDGGATWTAKTIFVPTANANPAYPQNCLQFANTTVDQTTGTLYIPFLRFSNADQDFIQMMISDDAGETFRLAKFNVSGAPDATVLPVTQPGHLTECGATRSGNSFSVNLRLAIHGAAKSLPSLTGFPRYVQASRLTLQPAFAARNGLLYLAWNNSSSSRYGNPASQSNILFVRSENGGDTWSAPTLVNPLLAADVQHVLPSLAIDQDPNDVHISYFTQHANGTVDLDMANSHDRGATFPASRTVRVSSESFNLPPTNVPVPTAANPFAATNYDRQIAVCYGLGEYQGLATANGTVYSAWGDTRNLLTEPVNILSPLSGGTHPQQDVFFQVVKAQ